MTGATRGIGRAIALRLADEGCAVGLCARDADAVQRAAGELRALGVGAHGVAADVTDEAALTAAVDECARELRGLDLVVANAGGAAGGPALEDTTAADWERTLALNVTHPAVLMRAAVPHLRARGGGAAVLIASISGTKPQPRAQYAAAKAAEIHLAHTLARELGPDGIRVNAVSPGSILFEGGAGPSAATPSPRPSRRGWSASSRSAARHAEGGRRRRGLPALRARELGQRRQRRRRRRAEPARDRRGYWRQGGAPDLAARRLGQLGGELDDARVLVRRGLGLDVVLQLARERVGGRVAVAQHDDGAHHGAALVVGGGDHRGLGHRGVLDERRLDLEGADPVAGGDDDVVVAALEEQEAVVVLRDAVAGAPWAARRLVAEVAAEEGRAPWPGRATSSPSSTHASMPGSGRPIEPGTASRPSGIP